MTRPSPLPVFLDPFVGGGGVLVKLLGEELVPPVSWMGGKRRLALRILTMLGLHPRQRVPMVLGDGSWWGWVWPLCLDPVTGPLVSAWLRSWRSEDPRALWFRLRDAGPAEDLIERAAGLLWLQARAASGVPVWWEDGEVLAAPGKNRTKQFAHDRGANGLKKWDRTRAGNVGPANQAHATEPRVLVHRDPDGSTRANAGKGFNAGGAGGMIDPGTIATRLDAIRLVMAAKPNGQPRRADQGRNDGHREKHGWRLFKPEDVAARLDATRGAVLRLGLAPMELRWRQDAYGPPAFHAQVGRGPTVQVHHRDALDVVCEWAPVLGSRARAYLDPPYLGCTGYPMECPREDVLTMADLLAQHGARVVLSEAVGLAAELGTGWREVCLRRGPKPEWVTLHGCSEGAEHGQLFAQGAA